MSRHMNVICIYILLCAFIGMQVPAFAGAQSVHKHTLAPLVDTDLKIHNKRYTVRLQQSSHDTWNAVHIKDGKADGNGRDFRVMELTPENLTPEIEHEFTEQRLLEAFSWNEKRVCLIHENRIVGYYVYTIKKELETKKSFFNRRKETTTIKFNDIEVTEDFRGTGAADILLEDFYKRVLESSAVRTFEAEIGRDSDHVQNDKRYLDKYTFDSFKDALGMLSTVNIIPSRFEDPSLVELTGKARNDYIAATEGQAQKRRMSIDDNIIIHEKNTGAHFIVLEGFYQKGETGINTEKAIFDLARMIENKARERLFAIPEKHTVAVDDIKSSAVKKVAGDKKQVTLIRSLFDYADADIEFNPYSIEAQIALYTFSRDYDHRIGGLNSFPTENGMMAFDFDKALSLEADDINDFFDRELQSNVHIKCRWAEIFADNAEYKIDYEKILKYAKLIKYKVSDAMIEHSINNAGFDERAATERIDALKRWRDNLITDLETLISLTRNEKFRFGQENEATALMAA